MRETVMEPLDEATQRIVDALVASIASRDALLSLYYLDHLPGAKHLSLPGNYIVAFFSVNSADNFCLVASATHQTPLEAAIQPFPPRHDQPEALSNRLENARRLIIQALLLRGADPWGSNASGRSVDKAAEAGRDELALGLLTTWVEGTYDWKQAEFAIKSKPRGLQHWLVTNGFDRAEELEEAHLGRKVNVEVEPEADTNVYKDVDAAVRNSTPALPPAPKPTPHRKQTLASILNTQSDLKKENFEELPPLSTTVTSLFDSQSPPLQKFASPAQTPSTFPQEQPPASPVSRSPAAPLVSPFATRPPTSPPQSPQPQKVATPSSILSTQFSSRQIPDTANSSVPARESDSWSPRDRRRSRSPVPSARATNRSSRQRSSSPRRRHHSSSTTTYDLHPQNPVPPDCQLVVTGICTLNQSDRILIRSLNIVLGRAMLGFRRSHIREIIIDRSSLDLGTIAFVQIDPEVAVSARGSIEGREGPRSGVRLSFNNGEMEVKWNSSCSTSELRSTGPPRFSQLHSRIRPPPPRTR
ncbi:hypothetical protein P7C70_g4403, partial [Phenoliferia sp. Uapishka_3]